MKESEEKLTSVEDKKAKIRERYKGVSEDQLSVIPALPKLDIFDKDKALRSMLVCLLMILIRHHLTNSRRIIIQILYPEIPIGLLLIFTQMKVSPAHHWSTGIISSG